MAAPTVIVALVLLVIGCLLLSALLVTVILSERLRRRDLVFNNFLSTWILSSALNSTDLLALLSADKSQEKSFNIHSYALIMITMISTLNMSIHLWFIMHEGMHPSSIRTKKLRTLILVVTPYLFGLLVIVFIFSETPGLIIFALAWILAVISNTILDVVLLIKFWRYHWKTRETEIDTVMSLPFLFRLLAFALYQVLFVLLFIAAMANEHSESSMMGFKTVQYSFPLLAFAVLGSHSDIWQLWLPCFRAKKNGHSSDVEKEAVSANRTSEDTAAEHLLGQQQGG